MPNWDRLVPITAVAAVLVALLVLIIVVVLRGASGQAIDIAGLIAFVSVLVGVLGNLAQGYRTQQKLNGHLGEHVQLSTEHARLMANLQAEPGGAEPEPKPPGGEAA